MWWASAESVMMVLCEAAAVAALLALAPLLYATLRRTLVSHETRRVVYSAQVAGCDEPACPYYEKNLELLMVPARRTKS